MRVPTIGTKIQGLTISSSQSWTAPQTCWLVGKAVILNTGGQAWLQYASHPVAGDPFDDYKGNCQVAFHILVRKGQTIQFHLENGGVFQEMALFTVEWAAIN